MIFQHHHANPHQLKSPSKEIIKATTWGSRHNNLPPLVALSHQENQLQFFWLTFSLEECSRPMYLFSSTVEMECLCTTLSQKSSRLNTGSNAEKVDIHS